MTLYASHRPSCETVGWPLPNSAATRGVAPGDERFVMIRQTGEDVAGKLILVQNFFEELKRLVPN